MSDRSVKATLAQGLRSGTDDIVDISMQVEAGLPFFFTMKDGKKSITARMGIDEVKRFSKRLQAAIEFIEP